MNKLKGFTLIEVLLAVLIISILLLIIISNLFVRKDVVKNEVDNINYKSTNKDKKFIVILFINILQPFSTSILLL